MKLAATLDAAVDGDEVAFRYAVRNRGTDHAEFQFPTAQAVEVLVYEDSWVGGDLTDPADAVDPADPAAPAAPTDTAGPEATADRDPADAVWRYGADRMFAQVVSEATLEPGEELVRTAEWLDPAPGEYVAVAHLTASPDARAVTTLVVE